MISEMEVARSHKLPTGVRNKKVKKKLTSVSFAFTLTYTLEKLTLSLFSPKRTWKILKYVQNAKEKTFHFITLPKIAYGEGAKKK